jgi:hypothetical protein
VAGAMLSSKPGSIILAHMNGLTVERRSESTPRSPN